MKILMVSAENDALPGGKVGGIGDVIRDIPPALAAAGQQVDVVTPGYNAFSKRLGAEYVGKIAVFFAGHPEHIELFKVPAKTPHANVSLWVLEHPLFAAGGSGKIYCDDPPDRPYATDASKFALFCAAVANGIINNNFGAIDVLHLHDWHAAMVAVLRAYDPAFNQLKSIHTVFSIHNLALQGIRPLAGDESSLQAWFPELIYEPQQINDPRVAHCFNPMRAGINLVDKVHAVSPTYAGEILMPSNVEHGYFGGEDLQLDLQRAAAEGRLHGILNGCEYPEQKEPVPPLRELFFLCENEVLKWLGDKPEAESVHVIAVRRLAQLNLLTNATKEKIFPPFIVTSVGRITEQKVLLMQQIMDDGNTALDHLLEVLGNDGIFIMLGSGDYELERFLTRVAARQSNFVFLKGYSETLSQTLHDCGDLFLMPSSFEPCGISQMLAMRSGQPCLVHRVGGLADTVINNKNGFSFTGDNLKLQAENMVSCFETALKTSQKKPKTWQKIAAGAASARFLWSDAAKQYLSLLYVK